MSHPMNHPDDPLNEPMNDPAEFWENRYVASDRVWSGRVNRALADVASTLTPGRALDLGCGEGADVIWLAQHGWQATGVDIAPSAIAHARDAAAAVEESAPMSGSATFVVNDLETPMGAEQYDLVTACFLQSPVALSRSDILRRASELVAPGGHLLIVSHAVAPPWHPAAHHHEALPQPSDDLATLQLSPDLWDVEIAEVRQRQATGPDGQPAMLDDGVLMVRRR